MPVNQLFSRSQLNTAILAVSLASATTAVYAEVETNAVPNEPSATLDTIYITAQKIDRTSQETVDSVKLVSEQQIKDNNYKDYTQLFESTANVSFNKKDDFNIRGISRGGPTNNGSGAAAHSIIVDGVPQTRDVQKGAISTWDLETVEILRGPQSTTTGRNSLAGAVVLKTNDPSFTNGGEAQVSYGSNNTYQAAATITGGITDDLAYRFSVEQKHTDGDVENPNFNIDDFNESTTQTIRGKLLYYINDDNELQFTVARTQLDKQGSNSSINPDTPVNIDNFLEHSDTTINNFSIDYSRYLTDDWRLHSTTAYTQSSFDRSSDNDGNTGGSVWNQARESNNLSQELLLNYDDDDKLKAVFGLYASKGEGLNDIYGSEWRIKYVIFDFTIDYFDKFKDSYENYAAFFNADYKITPKLTLITGLRYDYDNRDENRDPEIKRLAGYVPSFYVTQASGEASGDNSNSVVLPKLGFDYAWTDNLNTGLLYQQGYRPGGASTNPIQSKAKDFDPEYTDNYELSLRFKDDEDKLTLTTNLFYIDWKDQQVSVRTGRLPYDEFVTNAGKSHLYGAEVEGSYQVTPALLLTAGVGTVKTEFDEFNVTKTRNYNGNEFAFARDLNANLGLTYRDANNWFVGTNATYNGNAYKDAKNTIPLKPYTLLNMKAGYEQDNWSLYANVDNLLDETYYTDQFATEQGNEYAIGDSRVYGVTVNYKW